MNEIEKAQQELRAAESAATEATASAEAAKAVLAEAEQATQTAADAMATARIEHQRAERAWDGEARTWAPVETARRAFEQAELRHRKSEERQQAAARAVTTGEKAHQSAERAAAFAEGRVRDRKIDALVARATELVTELSANFGEQTTLCVNDFVGLRERNRSSILRALMYASTRPSEIVGWLQ